MCLQSSKVHKIISMYLLCWGCTIVKCSCDICCSIKVLSTRINWKINKLLISIAIHISKGAKVTSQPVHMHYHFFCPAPKIQGKSNLSKVGYWEQLSDKPRNSFSCPVLTYHFLVPIGALEDNLWDTFLWWKDWVIWRKNSYFFAKFWKRKWFFFFNGKKTNDIKLHLFQARKIIFAI